MVWFSAKVLPVPLSSVNCGSPTPSPDVAPANRTRSVGRSSSSVIAIVAEPTAEPPLLASMTMVSGWSLASPSALSSMMSCFDVTVVVTVPEPAGRTSDFAPMV